MDIRPIDVFDDEQFHRWHQIGVDALTYGRDYATVWTRPEAEVRFRRPFRGPPTWPWQRSTVRRWWAQR